jgi:hypothetical protein
MHNAFRLINAHFFNMITKAADHLAVAATIVMEAEGARLMIPVAGPTAAGKPSTVCRPTSFGIRQTRPDRVASAPVNAS